MATQLYRTVTGQSQKDGATGGGLAPPPDMTKITTTNTQTGVLNHLSEAQEQLLVEFKQKLEKDGWWSPNGINGKPTHDDDRRYLRARKFDVQGAIGQFTDTEKWMKEQHVEELYENFDVDFFERARVLYPQWTGRRDRRGIPLYVYEIKGLDSKAVDKYQKESTAYKAKLPKHKGLSTPPKLLPLFALYHNLLNFVLPFCSTLERPNPEVPVTNSTNIVDIQGVSLRQFWNLKAHMQDASVLATAHYPETLDRIFIIGAPNFFPTVWGWVKRWFDPVTVSKIFILSKAEVGPTLAKFMEPESIPKKYGGKLDWAWGDMPSLDQETRTALERDGNKGWVKGPALWLNGERIVVGSENGKLRRSPKEIAEKKPIIYAADYTEEPVHPEKRRSSTIGSAGKKSLDVKTMANGTALQNQILPESPSALVQQKSRGDPAAAATTAGGMAVPAASMGPIEAQIAQQEGQPPATSMEAQPPATPKKQEIPAHINAQNVRNSPMGDSQVNLPVNQAASPSTTAEYISPMPSTQHLPPQNAPAAAPLPAPMPSERHETREPVAPYPGANAAGPIATSPVPARPTVAQEVASHPPGHAQPGPLPKHVTEVNKAIAHKLENESTVIIPATADGVLPHPDIVVASDGTKGLAMEAEKLALSNGTHAGRPQPERFVTAMEIPH